MRQIQNYAIESQSPSGRATAPFSFHLAQVDFFDGDANLLRPIPHVLLKSLAAIMTHFLSAPSRWKKSPSAN
jgi:hypothetical protein